jgi:hypothetical protein
MVRSITRAAAVGLFGAMAGALCLTFAFSRQPELTLDMDRELPRTVSGVYPPERSEDLTFAWTTNRAQIALSGVDRRVSWICTVRFRGGRGEPIPQPVVDVSVDGLTAASRTATNEYQDLDVTALPRDRDGLVLTIAVSSTVVPGPHDTRQLGVQLDRLACRPGGEGIALPPRRALLHATVAAAILGAALSLIDIIAVSAVGATLLLAAAQAVPFSTGAAPYDTYGGLAVRLALWIGLAMVAAAGIARRLTGQRLRNTAKFVLALSAGVLYLQLLALLHPSKTVVDAVFQAHRLEWVLSGRFLFTQAMGSGVQFPYAIGLYVFAAPWSLLTDDYVTLLRIVVCASEIVAGTLLYVMVVRTWGDRLSGAVATALFSLVPMKYVFIGSANLTNVFGQSVALGAMAAVTTLSLGPGRFGHVAVLIALAAWAFLCHVSTAATLLTTLTITACLYWWCGGPALKTPAHRALVATIVAAVLSIVVYYGHFGTVYTNALRLGAPSTSPAPAEPAQPAGGEGQSGVATRYRTFTPLPVRIRDALVLTVQSTGWPILILAGVGAWRVWIRGAPDRLVFSVIAWTLTYFIFLAVAVMRVDMQYQRYSYEFVGRLTFATYSAAMVLAGHGAAWAWRAGRVARIASAVLLVSAVVVGIQNWLVWLQ